MPVEALSYYVILAPLVLVVGFIYVVGPTLPITSSWARKLVIGVIGFILARYLVWRLFVTVLPADGTIVEIAWIWAFFVIELFALCDTVILFFTYLRITDRRREADQHERRLRREPAEKLPRVDVFITSYNEPLDVLEKTIIGALSLDYPNFEVWVLDDGRRIWLRDYCSAKGVGYITRPHNAGAKAGNINHALSKTNGEFFAVFDADFVPQRNFLIRTIGFFDDPKVGIVQVPHTFYNHDPLQTNFSLHKRMPDEQRLFYDSIMPSRDGWDAAFCCGSNSVTRRQALREIGDALPTSSVTEDMLLTLALLRKGFTTRYLCERLAYGLAPESVKAYFIQRQRWARGAIQIMFLPEGPFGRGHKLIHRMLFIPTHWISQAPMMILSILAPIVILWTGLRPLVGVTVESILYYLMPMVFALIGGVHLFAQQQFFPLTAQVVSTFQSFKILPVVLATLINPRNHTFKVTPKGSAGQPVDDERVVFWICVGAMILTIVGLAINATAEYRIIEQRTLIPIVAFWSVVNLFVLMLICMICLQAPIKRKEERFEIDGPILLRYPDGRTVLGRTRDISLSGAAMVSIADVAKIEGVPGGTVMRAFLPEVGYIEAVIVRIDKGLIGIQFRLPASVERDLLIRKLFTGNMNTATEAGGLFHATFGLVKSIWTLKSMKPAVQSDESGELHDGILAPQSRVFAPDSEPPPLTELAAQRREFAA